MLQTEHSCFYWCEKGWMHGIDILTYHYFPNLWNYYNHFENDHSQKCVHCKWITGYHNNRTLIFINCSNCFFPEQGREKKAVDTIDQCQAVKISRLHGSIILNTCCIFCRYRREASCRQHISFRIVCSVNSCTKNIWGNLFII